MPPNRWEKQCTFTKMKRMVGSHFCRQSTSITCLVSSQNLGGGRKTVLSLWLWGDMSRHLYGKGVKSMTSKKRVCCIVLELQCRIGINVSPAPSLLMVYSFIQQILNSRSMRQNDRLIISGSCGVLQGCLFRGQ